MHFITAAKDDGLDLSISPTHVLYASTNPTGGSILHLDAALTTQLGVSQLYSHLELFSLQHELNGE
jgi:hypothetical protein